MSIVSERFVGAERIKATRCFAWNLHELPIQELVCNWEPQ